MADALDSKSSESNLVRVRVPPLVLSKTRGFWQGAESPFFRLRFSPRSRHDCFQLRLLQHDLAIAIPTGELVALKLRVEEVRDSGCLDIVLHSKLFFTGSFFHVLKRASLLLRIQQLTAADVASFDPSFLRR